MNLEAMTNRRLAAELETRGKAVSAAMDCVFGQFDRMDIPFSECCARLGADSPHVASYKAKLEALGDAQIEARMRVGPEPSFMLETYLLKSPRHVRKPAARAAA